MVKKNRSERELMEMTRFIESDGEWGRDVQNIIESKIRML